MNDQTQTPAAQVGNPFGQSSLTVHGSQICELELHLAADTFGQSELATHSTQLPPLHINPGAQSLLTLQATQYCVDVEQCLSTALDAQLASVRQPTQVFVVVLHLLVAPEQLASAKHPTQNPVLVLQTVPDLQSVLAVQALLVDFVSQRIINIMRRINKITAIIITTIKPALLFFLGGC
jgi:hypothetical protein